MTKETSESIATISSLVLILALIPGSFVGAFFLIRKWVTGATGRVLLTIVLGGIFLIAGAVAIVAGCLSIAPLNIK